MLRENCRRRRRRGYGTEVQNLIKDDVILDFIILFSGDFFERNGGYVV